MAEADVDGFNLSRTVMPECLHAFINLVVPLLQQRGLYKTAYALGAYREKLFGMGPRLPPTHPAAGHRNWGERTDHHGPFAAVAPSAAIRAGGATA